MPDINSAITINVTVAQPTQTSAGWGAGAIVGVSDYATKNAAKRYTSLQALIADHGDGSAVSLAASSAFAQGIGSMWAVSVNVAATTPTATEITAALNSLLEVDLEPINAACLAGIYSDNTTLITALQTWAETNDKIFVVTNPKGATVTQITTAATALDSAKGMFVAHNTDSSNSVFVEDVAAAALAVLLISKPGDTLMWADIAMQSTPGQFLRSDQATLESNRVNYLLDLQNNGLQKLSNDLSLATSASSPKFIDITISRMYITDRIRTALAEYRINTRKIPYTQQGIEYVRSVILAAMEFLIIDGVLAGYDVSMPNINEITTADKEARKLTGIKINCVLAGNIHEFVINLTMEVA